MIPPSIGIQGGGQHGASGGPGWAYVDKTQNTINIKQIQFLNIIQLKIMFLIHFSYNIYLKLDICSIKD